MFPVSAVSILVFVLEEPFSVFFTTFKVSEVVALTLQSEFSDTFLLVVSIFSFVNVSVGIRILALTVFKAIVESSFIDISVWVLDSRSARKPSRIFSFLCLLEFSRILFGCSVFVVILLFTLFLLWLMLLPSEDM